MKAIGMDYEAKKLRNSLPQTFVLYFYFILHSAVYIAPISPPKWSYVMS